MEDQLQFIANLLSLFKKFYGQGPAAAAVFEPDSHTPQPHCAICLTDICGGDRYRKLPLCGHYFHAHCIDVWFQSHSTCPLCRTQIPENICINENRQLQHWNTLLSNMKFMVHDFLERICNPLNEDLSSMLYDNVRS